MNSSAVRERLLVRRHSVTIKGHEVGRKMVRSSKLTCRRLDSVSRSARGRATINAQMDWLTAIGSLATGALGGLGTVYGLSRYLGDLWLEKQKAR